MAPLNQCFYILFYVFLLSLFTYISLLIIPCMIVYVTNKQEPWTCSPTAFNGTYVITHYTAWYSLVRWSVGSDCFLTTTEPLQSSFSIEPRPPRSGDLGPIVLARIRARLPCSHMPKRTELRGETRQVPKQRARCESTLSLLVFSKLFAGFLVHHL